MSFPSIFIMPILPSPLSSITIFSSLSLSILYSFLVSSFVASSSLCSHPPSYTFALLLPSSLRFITPPPRPFPVSFSTSLAPPPCVLHLPQRNYFPPPSAFLLQIAIRLEFLVCSSAFKDTLLIQGSVIYSETLNLPLN